MQTSIYDAYVNSSLESWFSTLYQSVSQHNINGLLFPSFPSDEIQRAMVGFCGVHTLKEISMFYAQCQEALAKAQFTFSERTKILDFGCGFGRLTRFFLKDAPGENIFAADCTKDFINICQDTFPVSCIPPDNFLLNTPLPPLDLPSGTFDLVTAYSVFTHLAEHAATAWLDEMHRILKPGGVLVITLRQKSFLEQSSQLSRLSSLSHYEQVMYDAFGDFPLHIQRYVRGEYLYHPSGGGNDLSSEFYGDTVVPPVYVRKNWLERFDLLTMFDDISRCSQAFLALRAK